MAGLQPPRALIARRSRFGGCPPLKVPRHSDHCISATQGTGGHTLQIGFLRGSGDLAREIVLCIAASAHVERLVKSAWPRECRALTLRSHFVWAASGRLKARAFVALTPSGVSSKIPASLACSEIDPEPASIREGAQGSCPRPEKAPTRQETTMSDDSRRGSRRPRQIQVELLEGRALLSASSVSSSKRVLLITPSSEYANQQEGTFTVTLTLAKAQLMSWRREGFGLFRQEKRSPRHRAGLLSRRRSPFGPRSVELTLRRPLQRSRLPVVTCNSRRRRPTARNQKRISLGDRSEGLCPPNYWIDRPSSKESQGLARRPRRSDDTTGTCLFQRSGPTMVIGSRLNGFPGTPRLGSDDCSAVLPVPSPTYLLTRIGSGFDGSPPCNLTGLA